VIQCPTVWQRPANVQPPATDDHPFVYLDGNSIPALYLVTLGLILLASLLLVRPASGRYRTMAGYVDLFFMGRHSCCLRRRTSSSSPCYSAPPGSSTRW
jgi:hypothetical protein